MVRLTATLRLKSRLGSKWQSFSEPVLKQALHGDGGPEHYKDWANISSGLSDHTLNGELAFLFAVLQAEQAVEFFFGRLTAIDACVASMRGGPGASGNGLDLSWCPIFESGQ